LAAKILLSMMCDGVNPKDTVNGGCLTMLGQLGALYGLRPQLRGILAEHVDDMQRAPDGATFGGLSFWWHT
jgi:hypothetical protein